MPGQNVKYMIRKEHNILSSGPTWPTRKMRAPNRRVMVRAVRTPNATATSTITGPREWSILYGQAKEQEKMARTKKNGTPPSTPGFKDICQRSKCLVHTRNQTWSDFYRGSSDLNVQLDIYVDHFGTKTLRSSPPKWTYLLPVFISHRSYTCRQSRIFKPKRRSLVAM